MRMNVQINKVAAYEFSARTNARRLIAYENLGNEMYRFLSYTMMAVFEQLSVNNHVNMSPRLGR